VAVRSSVAAQSRVSAAQSKVVESGRMVGRVSAGPCGQDVRTVEGYEIIKVHTVMLSARVRVPKDRYPHNYIMSWNDVSYYSNLC
jgi:hypothetical protein